MSGKGTARQLPFKVYRKRQAETLGKAGPKLAVFGGARREHRPQFAAMLAQTSGALLPPESRPQIWVGRPRANVNGLGSAPPSGVYAVAVRPHHHSTALCAVTKPLRRAVGGFFGLQRSAVGSASPDASWGRSGGLCHSHTRRALLWPPIGGLNVKSAAGGGFLIGWGSGFLAKPKRGGVCACTDRSGDAQLSHKVLNGSVFEPLLHRVASL